jgi:hypothetical protein
MTKSEAKILETDVVIFPMKFGQEDKEKIPVEVAENKLMFEEKTVQSNNEGRFARLKKSLRKRSASIL